MQDDSLLPALPLPFFASRGSLWVLEGPRGGKGRCSSFPRSAEVARTSVPKSTLKSLCFPFLSPPPPHFPGPVRCPSRPFPLLIPPPSFLWAWEKPYARSPGGRSPFPPPPPSPRQETLMLQVPPPSSLFSAIVRPRLRPRVCSPARARTLVHWMCQVLVFPSLSTPTTRREVRPIAELPPPVRPASSASAARRCSSLFEDPTSRFRFNSEGRAHANGERRPPREPFLRSGEERCVRGAGR